MSALKSLTRTSNSLLRISRKASPIHRRIIPSFSLSNRSSLAQSHLPVSQSPGIFLSSSRSFSTTPTHPKGLSPESSDPQPPSIERDTNLYASAPADLSNEKYHELADEYFDVLIEKLEALQEQKEEVDVEYSAGVLTLVLPPHGTYVLNKQPPNKQIWLSSPLTGPKRYDYVMRSEGQDSKEGTGSGDWVYLRDGSTLSDLLEEECGVHVDVAAR